MLSVHVLYLYDLFILYNWTILDMVCSCGVFETSILAYVCADSYINLKSDGRRDMASFISVRALSKRPERGPARQVRACV